MRPAILLEGVSKRYRIYPKQSDRLTEFLSFGRAKRGHDFWAVRDVSLEVQPGVSLGLLGRNGAGKSTLLKIVSGVLKPTSGASQINGRLAALLQIGAGFNMEFTGRENVLMNGLILGLSRKEIIQRFDEIEEFANIGEFMDQQVKTYSSGMRARLGFAVAVNVQPEVLLVDETLSVGDAAFRQLGLQRMRDLRESGTTILFVSHSAGMVRSFCDEAALLHKGKLLSRGDTTETLDHYQALLSSEAVQRRAEALEPGETMDYEIEVSGAEPDFKQNRELESVGSGKIRHGSGEARVRNVEIINSQGYSSEWVPSESEMTVRAHIEYTEDVRKSALRMTIRDKTGTNIFSTDTRREGIDLGPRKAGERVIVDFALENLPLRHGQYHINTAIFASKRSNVFMDWLDVATAFEITEEERSIKGLVSIPVSVEVHEPAEQRGDRSA